MRGLSTPGFAGLEQWKQELIWDGEHATFEIETHVAQPFMRSLTAGSRESLLAFFQDSFQGTAPAGDPQVARHGPLKQQRWTAEGASRTLDAEGLVDHLLDRFAALRQVEGARMRVLKIARSESDPDVWTQQILVSARGRDVSDGLTEIDLTAAARCRFADDAEIEAGRIFTHWQIESETVRRCDKPLMEEVTHSAGLDQLPVVDNWSADPALIAEHQLQFAVEDFDRDGFPDIAAATFQGLPLLLRSERGERFHLVSEEMGLRRWLNRPGYFTHLCAWIDFNNDSYPDLLMGNRLYRNEQGQSLVDVTGESGLRIETHAMGCAVADYDCDGRLDLYVLYQSHPSNPPRRPVPWVDDDFSGAPNQLWRNLGDGRFQNVTRASGAGAGLMHTHAAAWMFADDDRLPDLYVANDFSRNVLLRNRGDGTFEDITDSTGLSGSATSMGAAAGDLNNDGRSDIYVGNMYSKMGRRILANVSAADYPPGVYQTVLDACAGNQLYLSAPGRDQYQESSVELGVNAVGWTHGVAMGDFDGDGWLDLYSTAGFMSADRGRPDG